MLNASDPMRYRSRAARPIKVFAVIGLAAWASGCGSNAPENANGGAGADGPSGGTGGVGGGLGAGGDLGGDGAFGGDGGNQTSPFAPGAVSCDNQPQGSEPDECCPSENLRPVPRTAASVLDLTIAANAAPGTCGSYDSSRPAVVLSPDPADYPMKVILPALDGYDPDCAELCTPALDDGSATAFGVGLTTHVPPNDRLVGSDTGRVLAISVPPPWYFVSGGCGEACAWTCLEGYQEFGIHSCFSLAYGDFGFATADPNAPSVEAVLELIEVPTDQEVYEFAPGGCCLFGDG